MPSIRRVAVIYDDRPRPETTGGYCQRALAQLVATEHFYPEQLAEVGADDFELFVLIDDGLRYPVPQRLQPIAYWAIDTHMDFAWELERARDCQFVFAAQCDGAQSLKKAGIASATWLPLACDPELHVAEPIEKTHDICFVGNPFPGRRAELVELLQREFPGMFVGRLYFAEMAAAYAKSRIVFNRSIKNDLNMRVFEGLASGSFLLTNALTTNGQEELFQDGIHLMTYRDSDELLAKAHYFLEHPDEREKIAQAGQQEVLARHTYQHRMGVILEMVERAVLQARETQTPKTLPKAVDPEPARASTRFEEAPQNAIKPGYFDFARPELLALVPSDARRILEIGCGTGRLGESIKTRQETHVTGIELNTAAAAVARPRLDRVEAVDVEAGDAEFAASSFDCVVCGDVLEHLKRPDVVLRKIHSWLAPGGKLIASIPNVRHHSVISGLIEGNWTYEPAGLLDKTHLRFFNRFQIERILYRTGFEIEQWGIVPGPGYDQWVEKGRPGQVRLGRLDIVGMPIEDAEEFFIYQYLVTATPKPLEETPHTSIVIVTHNELAYTKQCVESLQKCTDEPYELIFVDNGSTDGTVNYLRSIPEATVIENRTNRGFPAAANQGIQAARGEQIVLLNNDVVVTTGWLRRMLAALASNPDIGLVGPCTNCTSGPQRIEIPYKQMDDLEQFAWQWGKSHDHKIIDTSVLMGFCLLFRSSVVRELGFLDERFELGLFEDVDFCQRALAAGQRAVIAKDAFVHHFGHRTFIGAQIDADELLATNQQRFADKWRQNSSTADSPPRRSYREAQLPNPVSPRRKVSVPQTPAELIRVL